MPEATITCYCGSCALGLAEQAATCFFQCGCNSCRQIIQFGQAKRSGKFVPLPKLFYVPHETMDFDLVGWVTAIVIANVTAHSCE